MSVRARRARASPSCKATSTGCSRKSQPTRPSAVPMRALSTTTTTTIMTTAIITATGMTITTTTTITTTINTTRTRIDTDMSAIAIELQPPDLAPYRRSNTGVEWIHTFDSGKAGPHVLVNALTHGNEICGAIALDRLLRMEVRPTRGKLTLAFANVQAFQRFDTRNPYASRFIDE